MNNRMTYLTLATLAMMSLVACSNGDSKAVSPSPPSSSTARVEQSTSSSKATTASSSSSQTPPSSTEKVALQEVPGSSSDPNRTEPNPPLDQETLARLKAEMDKQVASQVVRQGQKVMLSVKPQLQEVWNYCAPTTVSMMLSTRGIVVDQYRLAKDMGTYEPFGTHNRDAIRVLNSYLFGYEAPGPNQSGYRLETVTSASPEEVRVFKERLRQNIADGYPLYYTFDVAKMYPGLKGEHNVIGIGYEMTADGQDIANVYYLDPSPNVQDPTYGGLKKVSPQELLNAMLTCVEPNYGW